MYSYILYQFIQSPLNKVYNITKKMKQDNN